MKFAIAIVIPNYQFEWIEVYCFMIFEISKNKGEKKKDSFKVYIS